MAKKLLNNILGLIIMGFLCGITYAEDSLIYYNQLFSKWHVQTDMYKIKNPIKPDELSDIQLIKASQIRNVLPNNIDSIYPINVIICDENYQTLSNFKCSQDSVTQGVGINLINLVSNNAEKPVYIAQYKKHNSVYVFVPEIYLVSSRYVEKVANYFSALTMVDSSNTSSTVQSTPLNLVKSRVTELLVAFILFFILGVFIKHFQNKSPVYVIKTFLNELGLWLRKMSDFTRYFFMLFSFVYILLLCILSFKDLGTLDIGYIFQYILDSINVFMLSHYSGSEVYVRISLLIITFVVILLFILLIMSRAKSVYTHLRISFVSNKPSKNFLKYSLIFSVLILFGLIIFFSIKEILNLISFFVLLILSVFIFAKNSGVLVIKLFTKGEKIFFSILLTVIFAFGCLFLYKSSIKSISIREEPLFNVPTKMILLPFVRDSSYPVKFLDYVINPDFTVFVDNICVFHPTYTRIFLRPITAFSDVTTSNSNFMLIGSKSEPYLRALLANPSLIKYVSTQNFTKYFTFAPSGDLTSDNYTMEISFSCKSSPKDFNIRVVQRQLDRFAPDAQNIMRFPGCDSSKDFVTYKVPFKLLTSEDTSIYEFNDFDRNLVTGFKLWRNNSEQKVDFLLNPASSRVLFEKYFNDSATFVNSSNSVTPANSAISSDLYVYSFDGVKDVDIKRSFNGINLASEINKLLNDNIIKLPFVVWSPQGNVVIKNDLPD